MENAGREPEKGGTSGRRARQIFAHRILFENPLLIALLGLYPVAAACHTLKNALELSVMLAVLIPPAAVLFCCVGGRIPAVAAPGRGIGLQRGAVPARRRPDGAYFSGRGQ